MSTMSSAAPESAIGSDLVDVAHDGALGPDDLDRRRCDVGRAAGAGEVGRRVADLGGRVEPDAGRAAGAREVGRRVADLAGRVEPDAGRAAGAGKSAGVSPTFAARLADAAEPGSSSADAALTATRATIATSPIASLRTKRRWDFMMTSSGSADVMR